MAWAFLEEDSGESTLFLQLQFFWGVVFSRVLTPQTHLSSIIFSFVSGFALVGGWVVVGRV